MRFSAGAVSAFAAAFLISEAVDPVYPVMRDRLALFERRKSEIEVITVGNSHGGTIEFPELGVQGFHFAMAGEDAFEAAYLVRNAASQAPLRYVLFAASYGMQRSDHAVVGWSDLRARRKQLYARGPLQRPIPGDLSLWVGGRLAPIVRDDNWMGVFGQPIRPREAVRLAQDGRAIVAADEPLGPDSMAAHGANTASVHNEFGKKTMAGAPDIPARVAATLDALAGELRARGVALVFFTPPYHESYLRGHDPVTVAETGAILRKIVAEHPNTLWLDYSTDPRFVSRIDLFRNSDHLNPAGGRVLSELLRECLSSAFSGARLTMETSGCPAREGRVAQPQAGLLRPRVTNRSASQP
jgi:hypothetical protein